MKKMKRGSAGIFILIALIAVLFSFSLYMHSTCKVDVENVKFLNEGEAFSSDFSRAFSTFLKVRVFACEQEGGNIFDKTLDFTRGLFGFDKSFYDFLEDLLMGLFIGFLIWLSYLFIGWSIKLFVLKILKPFKDQGIAEERAFNSGWLTFIGSSPWKIFAIGLFYAVLMQIPFINQFIQLVSFGPLLVLNNVFWKKGLQSIILAFYLGLAPGFIESYSRYKLRMRYSKKMIQLKARLSAADQSLNA